MRRNPQIKFRLYVAGNGPHSALAVVNLNAFCIEYLPDRHVVEVVDVLLEQRRAIDEGVMLTPLLVKLSPSPIFKIVGTLSRIEPMLQALGLLKRNR